MIYEGESKILSLLKKMKKSSIGKLAESSGLPESTVRRAVESLRSKGLVNVISKKTKRYAETEELKSYLKDLSFPEYRVYLKSIEGSPVSSLSGIEKSAGIGIAKRKGWVSVSGGKLSPVKDRESVISELSSYSDWRESKELVSEFLKRGLIKEEESKGELVEITEKGISFEENRLKKEFDPSVETLDHHIGKSHILSRFSDFVREIFLSMGFREMDGTLVESSFWNFDALFQPQDHPARDLADTFYVDGSPSEKVPDELIRSVKKKHSESWKYDWKEKEASKLVLRTHTTCLSARTLGNIGKRESGKFFSIGRVFRNEKIDFKHLAEFHQVEGIVVWENSNFRNLLGILKQFYLRLGFEKIRFRPSYFPYTEPSVEVEVYYEPKREWIELGGAGIFRKEVSEMLDAPYPVLAWGLSLERPLMIALSLGDIRKFYSNDKDFLEESRCFQWWTKDLL